MQYRSNLKVLLVALSAFGMVSNPRICELVNQISGLGMSYGTVCDIIKEYAKLCDQKVIPGLKDAVINSPVVRFDETGIRVVGKVAWGHTSSTDKITLLSAHSKRRKDGILAAGVLSNYRFQIPISTLLKYAFVCFFWLNNLISYFFSKLKIIVLNYKRMTFKEMIFREIVYEITLLNKYVY